MKDTLSARRSHVKGISALVPSKSFKDTLFRVFYELLVRRLLNPFHSLMFLDKTQAHAKRRRHRASAMHEVITSL
jgi:hypothetical protein